MEDKVGNLVVLAEDSLVINSGINTFLENFYWCLISIKFNKRSATALSMSNTGCIMMVSEGINNSGALKLLRPATPICFEISMVSVVKRIRL